jgi:DNA replication and repair protein RecF
VGGHLDPLRRAALFDRLRGGGQVWMTGTERSLFEGLGSGTTWFGVAEGKIDPL